VFTKQPENEGNIGSNLFNLQKEWLDTTLHMSNSFIDLMKQDQKQNQGSDAQQILSNFRNSNSNGEQTKVGYQSARSQLIEKCMQEQMNHGAAGESEFVVYRHK